MARNTASQKGSGSGGKYSDKKRRSISEEGSESSAGGNRGLVTALAGFIGLTVVVLILLAVFITRGGQGEDDFTPNEQGLTPVGDTVPNFSGQNLNGGGTASLDGDQNATMLVLFASWCPQCQNVAPIISELEEQYAADGLKVVMVGVDGERGDDAEAVQGFVEDFDISSPTLYQPDLAREYDVTGYPTVYILDGQNRVVGAHSGEAPRDVFEGWIEDALG